MPNHAPNGGVAETGVALSAGPDPITPSPDADSENNRGQHAKDSAKGSANKADKQARKAAREEAKAARDREKMVRAEAKAEEKKRKKANAKTEAAVAEKAAKARDENSGAPSCAPKSKSRKLRFEGSMDREEVASYLESITKGLRKGSIHFRQGEEAVELSPNERVSLSVKVSAKGDVQRLAFEVEWNNETSPELSIVIG